MNKIAFIGSWKLLSYEQISSEGMLNYPYGKNAIGYLIYTIEGYMSGHVMRNKRLKYFLEDSRYITADEKITIARDYIGYTGKYNIKCSNNTIVHYPEICSFPNMINTPLEKQYSFQDTKLVLITQKPENNSYLRVIWQRI